MDEAVREKISDFFMSYRAQEYQKGEILVQAGDAPPGIFYLMEGQVKQYALSKNGDELVVNIFKPFAFFPMSWALNETPNTYFFEAMTDIVLKKVPQEDAVGFLREHPDVLFDLLKRVYRGVDGILLRMTYLMSGSAYGRLITEILIQAKRFGGEGDMKRSLSTSERDLAAQSGMTRETVSRELKKLKDKGLVEFEKSILTIKNMDALEEELAGGV